MRQACGARSMWLNGYFVPGGGSLTGNTYNGHYNGDYSSGLNYNVYLDSSYSASSMWGYGNLLGAGVGCYTTGKTINNKADGTLQNNMLYFKVYPNQYIKQGSYMDTINVLMSF